MEEIFGTGEVDMRNSYPAIVVISSFLCVFGLTLFTNTHIDVILGWIIGSVGGAGAVAVYVIGEFNGK